ncbi:MAG: Coenzyme F420 hydrogenase/dehydrogenase, beta subunit C-terminal domain [Desulfosarcinaceae bacterium]|nr:Coenzyme F420 hydrogenase/dehydrogenase, beta subunit C-terminal domain [Desulfosarcinaceae bacterium]
MKTFFNLIQEVQKPGLCHRCGGCVTFCTAVNYGALAINDEGTPYYSEIEKCIECGLCYSICPEIDELKAETRRQVAWSAPMGRVIETTLARALDPAVRANGTDGGAVTALLLHLFDTGRIDGAIVTQPTGPFQRRPCLATDRETIRNAAGFYFDTSHGMQAYSEAYLTHASIEEFAPMIRKGLRRVALVGTPCQIEAFRRMQTMGVVPSHEIAFCFGLFCTGNFVFGDEERARLARDHEFDWRQAKKLNVKDRFNVHLQNGEVKAIPLADLDFMKRYACHYCGDYSAEYADVAFGGIGAPEGWTTVIARTPLGRAALADAKGNTIEELRSEGDETLVTNAIGKVRTHSAKKKTSARQRRREMAKPSVTFKT